MVGATDRRGVEGGGCVGGGVNKNKTKQHSRVYKEGAGDGSPHIRMVTSGKHGAGG